MQGKGTYVSARSASTTNMLIGAILPYKHDRLTLDILIGIENTVKQKGYLVIFSQTEENPAIEALNVRQLLK